MASGTELRVRQGFGLMAAAETMERVFASFDDELGRHVEELPTGQLARLLLALESFGDCRAWALSLARRPVLDRLPDAQQWAAEVDRLARTRVFHEVPRRLLELSPIRS